jgi:hypothetical protein
VYHPPEPTHASGHHPAPAVPAPSGGGVDWGAMPCKRAPPARSSLGIPTERTRLQRARQPAPCPPPTVYHPPEPTHASGHHPAPAVPAPSGGGVDWGAMPCKRAPPARSPLGIPTERTRLQRTRQPAPCPPPTVYHPPEPTHASGHHPAPAVPAPSGGGLGWGRCPASVRLRRAHRLASRLSARASSAHGAGTSARRRSQAQAPAPGGIHGRPG